MEQEKKTESEKEKWRNIRVIHKKRETVKDSLRRQ